MPTDPTAWCADFKGWFRTGDGERIDPLTISDAHSRYLLRGQAVEKTDTARVQAIFEAAFREYGMPAAIRTDNGAPFATRALAGLSRLACGGSSWDIVPERIEAGHPEQNGRHERMHRTLKQEVAQPPAATGASSNARWTAFVRNIMRCVRMKRWACARQRRSMSGQRENFRSRCRKRTIQRICWCAACAAKAIFGGSKTRCFLSEVLWASEWGCCRRTTAGSRSTFAQHPIALFDSHQPAE